ncbi:hypothetical protein POPTR_002G195600v4 [Populus trichocarpa]|jgi:hypothetical protein|uniref:Uncharacterized protein n=2 Tax=Populus trichocarpa TaxID=3694 RepID=A0A2K2BLG6_POPTR|nr:hypothetical protein POPTR_002G195600v4 [Populus trichocarpa]
MIKGEKSRLFSMEDLGQVYPLCSEYGAYQDNTENKGLNFFRDQQQPQQQQSPPKSSYLTLDDFLGSCLPAPAQPMQEIKRLESIAKNSKETLYTPALSSSLQLLRKYGSRKEIECSQLGGASDETWFSTRKKLSTEEIIRVAGSRFIQFSDQRYDDFSMLMHPFGYALSGLSEEETRDVELTHLLLATAEKVGYQQFDRASRLLSRCEWVASERSNPLQRVVYYFAEALQGRIHKATGRFIPEEMKGKPNCETLHGLSTHLAHLSMHQNVPISQVMQLTAIQAIIENVGSARKIHLIDLEIRSGVQWTALMQALADRQRRLDHLKITAVGLRGIQKIEETGKRLEIFARSMNFPFTFKPIQVSCMSEIKEELFETAADEAMVVVANMILRTMLSRPACLENLMRVIKNLNPSIMIVGEVEANHNSPTFVNRFIEALFFYGAYFDCLETCLKQNTEHRTITEATFSNGIENIVTMEGTDRIARSVKMDVWRAFFSRFRMVEVGFSESSLYQAGLIPKQFPCGSSCTLEKNGKCLIVGWKGTPLHSLSAWKFSTERLWRPLANNNF